MTPVVIHQCHLNLGSEMRDEDEVVSRCLPQQATVCATLAQGVYHRYWIHHHSLVLCLSEGPWQPTPPLFSILRPPLHTNIRSLHEVVNHPNPWSAPRSPILHSSF